jgi:hypothetical protein
MNRSVFACRGIDPIHPWAISSLRKTAIAFLLILLPQLALCEAHNNSAANAAPASASSAPAGASYVLKPESFSHYTAEFKQQEQTAIGKAPADPWPWMAANIPWFESSDAQFQEIYYFRWYSFQKHIVHTEHGDLLNEFLFKVKWAGYGNTVAVAVPHQLREARWLRDPKLADDDARFWVSPLATHNRDFSLALADSVNAVTLATGDNKLGLDLLPGLTANYHAWEATHQDKNGLFWSIDTRDGMEVSISGDGYRPTLNSYMYGDAKALERLAALNGNTALSTEFAHKAQAQRERVETKLWNPRDQFYEVVSPAADSGIRKEAKFKDPKTTLSFSNVRELIGYVPWYFDIPAPAHAVAWKQLFDPKGFAGDFGPPTAERRNPRFRYANEDQCQWNGPMWGFATTQTLVGLANLLNNGPQQSYIGKQDYLHLFADYVRSHRLKLPDGQVIPWLDEALDPDTGEWITRRLLQERKSPLEGRGAYYDHSGFIDPLVTGLIGLRPRADNLVVLNPLLPSGAWTYFALDGLPYHGHILTILYDQTGKRYGRGAGLTLLVDGKKKASRKDIGTLKYSLLSAK